MHLFIYAFIYLCICLLVYGGLENYQQRIAHSPRDRFVGVSFFTPSQPFLTGTPVPHLPFRIGGTNSSLFHSWAETGCIVTVAQISRAAYTHRKRASRSGSCLLVFLTRYLLQCLRTGSYLGRWHLGLHRPSPTVYPPDIAALGFLFGPWYSHRTGRISVPVGWVLDGTIGLFYI